MKLPVFDSAGPLLDCHARLVVRTREQTQRLADRMARNASKRDGFTRHGCICAGPFEEVITGATPRYYRISLAAQPS